MAVTPPYDFSALAASQKNKLGAAQLLLVVSADSTVLPAPPLLRLGVGPTDGFTSSHNLNDAAKNAAFEYNSHFNADIRIPRLARVWTIGKDVEFKTDGLSSGELLNEPCAFASHWNLKTGKRVHASEHQDREKLDSSFLNFPLSPLLSRPKEANLEKDHLDDIFEDDSSDWLDLLPMPDKDRRDSYQNQLSKYDPGCGATSQGDLEEWWVRDFNSTTVADDPQAAAEGADTQYEGADMDPTEYPPWKDAAACPDGEFFMSNVSTPNSSASDESFGDRDGATGVNEYASPSGYSVKCSDPPVTKRKRCPSDPQSARNCSPPCVKRMKVAKTKATKATSPEDEKDKKILEEFKKLKAKREELLNEKTVMIKKDFFGEIVSPQNLRRDREIDGELINILQQKKIIMEKLVDRKLWIKTLKKLGNPLRKLWKKTLNKSGKPLGFFLPSRNFSETSKTLAIGKLLTLRDNARAKHRLWSYKRIMRLTPGYQMVSKNKVEVAKEKPRQMCGNRTLFATKEIRMDGSSQPRDRQVLFMSETAHGTLASTDRDKLEGGIGRYGVSRYTPCSK
jgi:hypothetical protein